ncbi:MAG: hypothetical protein FWE94_01360 [Coriobacteriia bacterium]|nr:hypothetical protein [Coriobacteriia bacterium]
MSVFRRIQIVTAVLIAVAGVTAWAFSANIMAGASTSFMPGLEPASRTQVTIAIPDDEPLATFTTQEKQFSRVVSSPKAKATQGVRSYAASSGKKGSAFAPAPTAPPKNPSVSLSQAEKLALAQAILDEQIAKYPILAGTTVSFGDARGYQAIAYYTTGRIIISPNHTTSLEKIISHEVWHIIDWRVNGRIAWGENVPRTDWVPQ